SALAAGALVFAAAFLAGRGGDARESLVAGAATAGAPIVWWQGPFVQTGAPFSCFLMLAFVSVFFFGERGGKGGFFEGKRDEGGARRAASRWRWALRLALAAAVLTKGPLAIVLAGLVLLARCAVVRSWGPLRATHPFRSILVFLLLVIPWYVFAAR